MYSEQEIEMLRTLTETTLDRAKHCLLVLEDPSIPLHSFDAVTLDMAERLNHLSKLYAVAADLVGMARMGDSDCGGAPMLTREVFEILLP